VEPRGPPHLGKWLHGVIGARRAARACMDGTPVGGTRAHCAFFAFRAFLGTAPLDPGAVDDQRPLGTDAAVALSMSNANKLTIVLCATFTALTTLASTSDAHAQTAQAEDLEDVVTDTPAPRGQRAAPDPNADRGFLLPTAMTQPAGSITYYNYELLLHGVTYGITDRVQVSGTVLSPIVRDMPFVGFAAVKARVLSAGRFNMAVQGSLGWGHAFDISDANINPNVFSGGAGVFASYCLRQDCSSLLSASATYQLVWGGSTGPTHVVIYGGSLVHRVARNVSLMVEVTSAAGADRNMSGLDNLGGMLVSYGLRFHTGNVAADVGFLKPINNRGGSGELLTGIPFVSVSYRWQ
jgi:hypothetical protein